MSCLRSSVHLDYQHFDRTYGHTIDHQVPAVEIRDGHPNRHFIKQPRSMNVAPSGSVKQNQHDTDQAKTPEINKSPKPGSC